MSTTFMKVQDVADELGVSKSNESNPKSVDLRQSEKRRLGSENSLIK